MGSEMCIRDRGGNPAADVGEELLLLPVHGNGPREPVRAVMPNWMMMTPSTSLSPTLPLAPPGTPNRPWDASDTSRDDNEHLHELPKRRLQDAHRSALGSPLNPATADAEKKRSIIRLYLGLHVRSGTSISRIETKLKATKVLYSSG